MVNVTYLVKSDETEVIHEHAAKLVPHGACLCVKYGGGIAEVVLQTPPINHPSLIAKHHSLILHDH